MKDLQLRLEVEAAAQQWVAAIMQQNDISASIMEEALTKVQLQLKDLMLQEVLRAFPIEEENEPMEREEVENAETSNNEN